MRRLVRALVGVGAACAASACAVTEARHEQERRALTRRIVDDAIAYNEAYSSAISGQVLLNILRAYNRQPRQYMSMSGFANSDADSRSASVNVSGLPLGRLGEEWGQGAFGIGANARLEPEYRVEPFGENDFSEIALAPTSARVFQHYWSTGWNRDLLLFLLVERMEVVRGADVVVLENSPGTIAANCGQGYDIGGCAFIRAARELAARTNRPATAHASESNACLPIAVYDRDYASIGEDPSCAVRIVVGEETYRLSLRSLDAMVYYVGELMRQDAAHPPSSGAFLEARLSIRAAGSRVEQTPIFRIVEADDRTEREYAATVTYAGRRYSAGAPANEFCFRPDDPAACEGLRGDRSSSVLEFLVGILAYNQSDAAVRAPQNTIVR